MTKINVTLTGLDGLLKQLQAAGRASDDVIEETITDLALDTQAFAIQGIQGSGGGGVTYQKYKPRRVHTASAPGQYPATDTGRLAGSVRAILPTAGNMTAEVGTAVDYGPHLEFGTSRMAARPWLLPSFARAKTGIEKELKLRLEAKL
jgi:phage gpG-like protein